MARWRYHRIGESVPHGKGGAWPFRLLSTLRHRLRKRGLMRRRIVKIGMGVLLIGVTAVLFSCVSFSPFMIREAALPEKWPKLTPVGEVRVQTYPLYRAASISVEQADGGMGAMHKVLFRHIRDQGIPMTAPVDMTYAASEVGAGPTSMAFLYRSPQQGSTTAHGNVQVRDVEPNTFVSLGVRGGYRSDWIASQVARLRNWLGARDEWRVTGPPRYLGYNSPFVPAFMRYGEVQIPVESLEKADEEDGR